MKYKNFTLDKFQEDAIMSIEQNNSVVVSAPTGSGKTLIADYIINKYVEKGIRVIYTAPIKALSNQKYKDFCKEYGKDKIGLLTGDIVENSSAPILIMTTEIYRNMALTNDLIMKDISYVIFDEIHYINDVERGYVWEESVIFSDNNVRFLCLSATIPNSEEFASWIQATKDHEVDVVKHDKREVPLEKHFYDAELGITTLEKIHELADIPDYKHVRGRKQSRRPKVKLPSHIDLMKEIKEKVPCFFFCFSRKKCQDFALQLSKENIFQVNPKISPIFRKIMEGAPKEINELESMKTLRQVLPFGIAFHHAGLIPIMKEIVEELFSQGLINVLYTTETFAVGINMPAKTVCFENLRKFDGISFRFLNSKEYFQIAGRAGRRGIDEKGFVYSMITRRDFDYSYLKKITTRDIDPIKSQFRLSINTVLNMIKNHNEQEIKEILCKNFYVFQKYGNMNASRTNIFSHKFEAAKKKLEKMGYVMGDSLTKKGEFSSLIYADEILTGELFATDFYLNLSEYQLLLLLACLCYEPREKTEFYKEYPSKDLSELRNLLLKNDFFRREKKFRSLDEITAIIHPCYHDQTIFDIIENTSLLEGDLIRFFRQILDRIGQIKQASNDERLIQMVRSIQQIIFNCLRDIDVV